MSTTTSSPVGCVPAATFVSATQYDDVADAYDRLIRPKYDAIARRVGEVVEHTRDLRRAAVLELSAGTGALTRQLAPGVGGGYVATDISSRMLAVARRRCSSAGRIAWLRAGVEDVPLPGEIVDLVVSSLGPVQDSTETLAEAGRLLVAGGRLVACTWGDDYAELAVMQAARALVGMEPRPVTRAADLVDRARAAGFHDVTVTPFRLPVIHDSLASYVAYRQAFGPTPVPEGLTSDDLLAALRDAAAPYVDRGGRVVLDWHLLVLAATA